MPPAENPTSLAFSPDGKTLAGGCSDHVIRLWDTESGKEIAPDRSRLAGTPHVRFLSDGKTLLVHRRYEPDRKYAMIDPMLSFWDVKGTFLRQEKLASEKAHAFGLTGDARVIAYGNGPNFGFMFRPTPNGYLQELDPALRRGIRQATRHGG